jgi:hypothetical protein
LKRYRISSFLETQDAMRESIFALDRDTAFSVSYCFRDMVKVDVLNQDKPLLMEEEMP